MRACVCACLQDKSKDVSSTVVTAIEILSLSVYHINVSDPAVAMVKNGEAGKWINVNQYQDMQGAGPGPKTGTYHQAPAIPKATPYSFDMNPKQEMTGGTNVATRMYTLGGGGGGGGKGRGRGVGRATHTTMLPTAGPHISSLSVLFSSMVLIMRFTVMMVNHRTRAQSRREEGLVGRGRGDFPALYLTNYKYKEAESRAECLVT